MIIKFAVAVLAAVGGVSVVGMGAKVEDKTPPTPKTPGTDNTNTPSSSQQTTQQQ